MLTPQITEEIRLHILESSDLAKADILQTWDLDEPDYKALQFVFRNDKRIEAGPQKIGGFRAKFSRRRGNDEDESPGGEAIHLRSEWETDAVARLVDLLSHQELEDLLGGVKQSFRYQLDGRRGTKQEMAAALVIRHGEDLLANGNIRGLLGRHCKVAPPKRWHPGKHGALAFVRAIQFPPCLAGEPSEPPLPEFLYLPGQVAFPPLLDFQVEVRSKLLVSMGKAGGRALLTLPTGAGKTRVAVETIRDWLGGLLPGPEVVGRQVVLWLAHTEELCEQAHQGFTQIWEHSPLARPATLVRFWGDYTTDADGQDELVRALDDRCIVISTPGRVISLLRRASDPRLVGKLSERIGLVAVDEAHRAGAPSYREILHRLASEDARVMGMTATPFRKEYDQSQPDRGTRDLIDVFQELVEAWQILGADPRAALQERRILARPNISVIRTSTHFRMPRWADQGELSTEQQEALDLLMSRRADNSRRRTEILAHLLPLGQEEGNSVLYFGPSVQDAESMCFMLRRQGVPAAVVSGKTRPASRRKLIEGFRSGEVPVLCNCQVLTTGFDAPRVTHVVLGRPTVSRVLFEQMVGRGLRGPAFGGTDTCEIIIFQDEISGAGPRLGYEEYRGLWECSTRKAA